MNCSTAVQAEGHLNINP